jgi:putative nucleotidyltransferase with HDIG domain
MRVHITDLQSGDRLVQDIFNEYGIHVLSRGAVLGESELSHMAQHRIDYVDIEWRAGLTPQTVKPSTYNPLLRPLYQDAVAGCEQLFEKALEEGRVHEKDIKKSFQPLVDNFRTERDVVSLLLMLNSQHDYTYQHSVQVGMLSYYLARWMGWSEEQTVAAGNAGFLHDIGKCRISKTILNKPEKLTDQEYQEIQKHPQYGYEILKNSFDESIPLLAAVQHHERMDGTGYPNRLTADKIHPIAKIVSVADIYSAMISIRVYQQKRDLLYVLRELHHLGFHKLDPNVTHTFITHMVPNFIGKQAELSDGTMGLIVMINPSDFFAPLVQCEDRFVDLSRERQYEIVRVFM